jgi:L-alanine-DL-glutamate epimerase-like enolase superfamily enzyme
LPQNFIAFEYPTGKPEWWYDIVTGLPDPIVKDSFIDVWDTPGLGVDLVEDATRAHLRQEDSDFFE